MPEWSNGSGRSANGGVGATVTLAVAGFPPTAAPRELKNLCKLCDGFESALPNFRGNGKPPTLFVRFSSTEDAENALARIRCIEFDDESSPGSFLKAEFAQRDLQPAGAAHAMHSAPIPAAKRARTSPEVEAQLELTQQHASGMDTLACKTDGLASEELHNFFSQLPGFEALSARQSNCFVKFVDSASAAAALGMAIEAGFTLSFAKRSLILTQDLMSQGGLQDVPTEAHYAHEWAGSDAPHSVLLPSTDLDDPSMHIDTLACKLEGSTMELLTEYFLQIPGFVTVKANNTGSNCFVKFSDPSLAQCALMTAKDDGFSVDLAKRNLAGNPHDSTPHEQRAVPRGPARATPTTAAWQEAPVVGVQGAGIDTLACKVDTTTQEEIHDFFAQLLGFGVLRCTGRVCFLKFISVACAREGLSAARGAGYQVEEARRNLDVTPAEEPAMQEAMTRAGMAGSRGKAQGGARGPAGKVSAPPAASVSAGVDTLACKLDATCTEFDIRSFFEALAGYTTMRCNRTVGFIKFSSYPFASKGLAAAKDAGFQIEFARRNLESAEAAHSW